MKRVGICTCLILSIFFTGCRKDDETEDNSTPAENRLDQAYGNDPKQKFNIYLPPNRSVTATPILFLIHGGEWMSGDKNDFNSSIYTYAAIFPSYAIVNMSYRLYAGGLNKFPVQEQDIKSCIEYVLVHATDYNISQRFGLLGSDAGAHLAMLYAYKYGSSSYMPKAVVSISGPVDLIKMYNQLTSPVVKALISDVAGNITTSDSIAYINASPLAYVTSNSAPTLILQGNNDTIVPYQQANLLNDKLQLLNVVHTYKSYPNEGHNFSQAALLDIQTQTQTFLNLHLN